MNDKSTGKPGRYPMVFRPIRLGAVEVPNRIFLAPHGIPLEVKSSGSDLESEPALNRAYYFGERARGGVGLILHSTQVLSSQTNLAESPLHDRSIPAFRRVAEEVHRHGAKIMAEIWYVNWMQKTWERLGPEAPGMSPSAMPNLFYPSMRRAMTLREIDAMVEVYRRSTRNLREAGYDGIELHISHGSVVEYFLSPYFNKRTDDYGGSLENRARLAVRILNAIREELGPDKAVGIRINADEMLPGGLDEEATKDAIRYLVDLGLLDFVDIDVSVEPEQLHLMTTGMFDPILHNAERAMRVGEAAGSLPVLMAPGRLTDLADAEKLLAAGKAAMIGAARGLIADPELVNKSREGRESERRTCVAINACVDSLGIGWGCAINAAAGRENRWGAEATTPVERPMNVVVVGAGPAGLEAARIAAERGNRVTLLESSDRIGGAIVPWSKLPSREAMRTLPDFFQGQLEKLGVDIRLGIRAEADTVLALNPDVVVLATGSRYSRGGRTGAAPWPIPGSDQRFVYTPEDVLSEGCELSGKVVVIDDEGYHTACGIAEALGQAGCEVVYVTRKANAGASLGIAIGYVSARMRAAGVKIVTGKLVTEIRGSWVALRDQMTGEAADVEGVDHVVLATCREAVDELHQQLESKVPYVYLVGDALAPRGLREATYEGHRFGRLIGTENMPRSVTDELFRCDPDAVLVSAASV